MKINSTIIYFFLLISLLVFLTINFHNNNVLESRINTITKNNKPLNSEKTFKEDYYITQQSHDTNLLLVVFTVLIAFTGLFTYINIVERYNAKVSEIKDEIKKYESDWDKVHYDLDLTKVTISIASSNLNSEKAKTFLINKDFKNYFQHELLSISDKTDYYLWVVKTEQQDMAEFVIGTQLKKLTSVSNNIVTIKFDKAISLILDTYINNIRKMNNTEINKLVSIIHSKITT